MITAEQQKILSQFSAEIIAIRRAFRQTLLQEFTVPPEDWKLADSILAMSSSSRFNLYFFYPLLFQEAFQSVDTNVLKQLAWAGRAALDYIVLYDYLIDEAVMVEPTVLFSSFAFQREYLLVLQRIIPSTAKSFWHDLVNCENETVRALVDENKHRRNPMLPFTMPDFRCQAVGKAAMSRLAIYGLAALTDSADNEVIQKLICSNDSYNFARQITDDLTDWRLDYKKRHISFMLAEVLHRLNVATHEEYPDETIVGATLYQFVAPRLLECAESSLSEAISLTQECGPCENWTSFLEEKRDSVREKYATIAAVLSSSKRSKQYVATVQKSELDDTEKAVRSAVFFLLTNQESEGCWRDFSTAAFESEDWTTAYVGWALLGTDNLPEDARNNAVLWLEKSQFPQGGWGYHRGVVPDADSTAWAVRFLTLANVEKTFLEPALRVLVSHQQVNGGFSTYKDPDPIREYMKLPKSQDFSGWCGTQLCVSAISLAALLESDMDMNAEYSAKATAHLLKHQSRPGYWRSYWWAGNFYTTAHLLEALSCTTNKRKQEAGELGREWFLRNQQTDGGWSHRPGELPSSPFYTALALQGIATGDRQSSEIRQAAQRGIAWLLNHQLSDGSWESSALMVLPETDEKRPWLVKRRPRALQGTGIVCLDQRRIFTTATVLRSIVLCSTKLAKK